MDLSDKKHLASAFQRIKAILGVQVEEPLRESFFSGSLPNLLRYRQSNKPGVEVEVIKRYLLGVESYLFQPSMVHFYDIESAGRIVPLFIVLDRSITALQIAKTKNMDGRLLRLKEEKTFDGFESILFELVVASKYVSNPRVANLEFLEESNATQTPDIRAEIDGEEYFIECKKQKRKNDAEEILRQAISPKMDRTFKMLLKENSSALIELNLKTDPAHLNEVQVKDLVFASLDNGAPAVDQAFNVFAKLLPSPNLDTFALYPSPGYFYNYFEYDPEGDWHGLIPMLVGRWKTPSWLDVVTWQSAVKWRIQNEELIWKMQRLPYSLLFKGLKQLEAAGRNSILHYWFERDRTIGHRKPQLLHFYETLRSSGSAKFSWIVFNELSPSMTPLGRFDFTEHSHPIMGPNRRFDHPVVSGVFIADEDTSPDLGEWGVGHKLPSVDVDDESWKKKNRK